VAAETLGLDDTSLITFLPTSSLATPNASGTGGSTTSAKNCAAVLTACTELKSRMSSVLRTLRASDSELLPPPLEPTDELPDTFGWDEPMTNDTWKALVRSAGNAGVDLTVRQPISCYCHVPRVTPTALLNLTSSLFFR